MATAKLINTAPPVKPGRRIVLSRLGIALRTRWLAALLSCVVGLSALRLVGLFPGHSAITAWDIQNTELLLSWLRGLARMALLQIIIMLPIGTLISLSIVGHIPKPTDQPNPAPDTSPAARRSPFARSIRSLVKALLVASVRISAGILVAVLLALLIPTVGGGFSLLGLFELMAVGMGCLLGIWCGSLMSARPARRVRLAIEGMLVLVAAGIGVPWLVWQTTESTPLEFEPAIVTSEEKRRLVDLVRGSKLAPGEYNLKLEKRDVDILLAWGLSLGSPDRKATVEFGDDESTLSASIGLPLVGRKRYCNIHAAGQMSVDSGELKMAVHQLHLGRLQLPPVLLRCLTPLAIAVATTDDDISEGLRSVRVLATSAEGVLLVTRRDESGDGAADTALLSNLVSKLRGQQDDVAAIRAHLRRIVDQSAQLNSTGDRRFHETLQIAFRNARQRSKQSDPIVENRAAILALGIMLGHWRVETLLGSVADDELRERARASAADVTIQGRTDWTRHFWVSASIAVLSTESASDAGGLLKEELDAAKGGSGFSFADLLVDRAGTLFAIAATQDHTSARAIQKWLDGEYSVSQLVPEAGDLPEAIPDAQLQSDYGGVGGQRYNEIISEIERRLAELPATKRLKPAARSSVLRGQ